MYTRTRVIHLLISLYICISWEGERLKSALRFYTMIYLFQGIAGCPQDWWATRFLQCESIMFDFGARYMILKSAADADSPDDCPCFQPV